MKATGIVRRIEAGVIITSKKQLLNQRFRLFLRT